MSTLRSSQVRTACGNCRFRKVKCDGLKPVCTQCLTRTSLNDECDYGDSNGVTTSEELQSTIQKLEARLHELEYGTTPGAVRLYHIGDSNEGIHPRGPSVERIRVSEDSPLDSRRAALQTFLSQHASAFAFFLNHSRFAQNALSILPSGHPHRPCSGLLNTVYYIASALRQGSDAKIPAELLLEAIGILATDNPTKIVQAIQAEVLLASWFLYFNKILEGKYHLGTAISLAVGAGLHKIRSPNPTSGFTRGMSLPSPLDGIEEGERIVGFWHVYAMSSIWDAILGPSTLCAILDGDGKGIDTPWAWDMRDYEQAAIPVDLTGGLTVHSFLAHTPSSTNGMSAISMFAKASTLFSKSKNFADSVSSTSLTPSGITNGVTNYLQYLDNLIDEFTSALTPLGPPNTMGIPAPALHLTILTHTLAYTSTIHLHSPFAVTDARSSTKSLSAANLVSQLLPHIDYLVSDTNGRSTSINPAFGALWLTVGRVFVNELVRLRGLRTSSAGTGTSRASEIIAMLRTLRSTMTLVGQRCPFVASQLAKLNDIAPYESR
ncbi:hypothetical protein VNI00_004505 [Paramarasmius palmivorus]|uniref:Zn(2)-C6 fungal-type domain-containing protein n=1 Tax=Paramarasmius palmivorus TaxID=297713 RepID=A0AAW0DHT9_9AGAR